MVENGKKKISAQKIKISAQVAFSNKYGTSLVPRALRSVGEAGATPPKVLCMYNFVSKSLRYIIVISFFPARVAANF